MGFIYIMERIDKMAKNNYHIKQIVQYFGVDANALAQHYSGFFGETENFIKEMNECLEKDDMAKLQKVVHKLKLTIASLNINDAFIIADELDFLLKAHSQNAEKAKVRVDKIIGMLRGAKGDIKEEFKELDINL